MKSYLRKTSSVDAAQYDGSAHSAIALDKRFPGLVGISIDKPASLVVISGGRLTPVPAGSWIVCHWRCGGIEVWSDESFRKSHSIIDLGPAPVIALPAPEQSA